MAEKIDQNIADNLIDMLIRQQKLYGQLQELSQKQSSLVDGNDPETLLKILAARQRVLDQLTVIDREMEPIRADWQAIYDRLAPQQRQEVRRLVSQIQEILGEVLARDARDTEELSRCQQQVAGKMRNASTGQRVNKAYAGQNVAPQSRYLDMHSG